ncbi:hypothetical protein [Paenibacillus hexagrammi]|uniref:Uncharacterized protein n=1 Tax=Paenibacillus hexagrammi TaxID=2908839 RepID=A0ABY3SC92_9BACL|nr:hypothetical protein [Paenibacillus sp. YPD9-1]UJF31624.1 hypothetical protein L0M14_17690 [Paenibacillus sp. YPD9-1]
MTIVPIASKKLLFCTLTAAGLFTLAACGQVDRPIVKVSPSPATRDSKEGPRAEAGTPASTPSMTSPSSPVVQPPASTPVQKPQPTSRADAQEESVQEGTLTDCGAVTLKHGENVSNLPLRCVKASYGAEEEGSSIQVSPESSLPAIDYELPAGLESTLAAYWMNSGDNKHGLLLLAPKHWISTRALLEPTVHRHLTL